jgi:autotransporter-associated beta strand protein/YVTN family beta-propeller protein
VINTATNSVISSIPVGNSPTGVAVTPNGKYVYVANQTNHGSSSGQPIVGTVSVINTATNSVVSSIPVGFSPTGITVTPNGQYVYVANMNNQGVSGTVSVISTATNTVVSTIAVGAAPIGVSVTPDGKYVYVSNSNIGRSGPLVGIVSVISTATNTVVGSIPVGTVPLSFGSFISPNIIVAQGGPLLVPSDVSLTPLGFQQFVNFNGGTIKLTGDWVTSRMVSLLAQGGTIDTNGFDANISGNIINPGSLTKIGTGTLTLSGSNTYSGGTNLLGGTILTQNVSALGTGPVTFGNGTTLQVQEILSVNGNWTVLPGTATVNGGTVQTIGDFNLGGGGVLIANANFNAPGAANINSTYAYYDGELFRTNYLSNNVSAGFRLSF